MRVKSEGSINKLFRYPRKHAVPVEEDTLVFIEDSGIDGDCHADGSERQISLLTVKEKEWMEKQEAKGICFRKYKENILLEGISLAKCGPGDLLKCGEVILEFTNVVKKCYPDICALTLLDKSCFFENSVRFARVIKGGMIQSGMEVFIEHLHNTDSREINKKVP